MIPKNTTIEQYSHDLYKREKVIVTGFTYKTKRYEMFKRLEGNRDLVRSRKEKIKKSIQRNGYIHNPIVINEKNEIIDGQGRFEALKELDMEIEYVIAPGAGLEQCVALNTSGTLWTMKDYIDSWCEMGNENYIRFRNLRNEYPALPLRPVYMMATGLTRLQERSIKSGGMIVKAEDLNEIRDRLDLLMEAYPIIEKRVAGIKDYYYYAVAFAVEMGANRKRLMEKLEASDIRPATSVKMALNNLSEIYNYNVKNPENRIYLVKDYETKLTGDIKGYERRWGRKG